MMKNSANLTVHERYRSPNGGLPFCLENLAHWLASDGRDKVLALLEEDYSKADHKRIQDCLCFLIDGIAHLDQEVVMQHVAAIQALLPDLQASNASYNEKANSVEIATDDWKAAATKARDLLAQWRRWMSESEQLRLGGISADNAVRVFCRRRLHLGMFLPLAFDSPASLRNNRKLFDHTISAVYGAIEQGHLANRLPADLNIRELKAGVAAFIEKQELCESLVTEDAAERQKDDELWRNYHLEVAALTQVLSQMKEVQLWSLFWLHHPEFMDVPAA